MKEVTGDIWDYLGQGWIVVPTNVGWRADGVNPMGSGVARQAAERYPGLPRVYGEWCRQHKHLILPWAPGQLIMFPTKVLNAGNPAASWKSKASLACITRSMEQLRCFAAWHLIEGVYMPRVGCGSGKLAWNEVSFAISAIDLAGTELTIVTKG